MDRLLLFRRVDWNSPAEIALDAKVYDSYLFCLLGVYAWEFILTFWYDFAIFSGRLKWRWPMALYFLSRYCTLGSIATAIITNTVNEYQLNCSVLMFTTIFFAGSSVYFSASIFVLRTVAVWGRRMWVIIVLALLWVGVVVAWSYNEISIVNVWEGIGVGCVPTKVYSFFSAPYILTEVLDVTTLGLTAYQLFKVQNGNGGRAGVATILFKQGLYYFLINVVANSISLVFILSPVNAVMHVVNSIFALTFASIMACRAFRDLSSGKVAAQAAMLGMGGHFWKGWTEGQSVVGPLSHNGTGGPISSSREGPSGVKITMSKLVQRSGTQSNSQGWTRHEDVEIANSIHSEDAYASGKDVDSSAALAVSGVPPSSTSSGSRAHPENPAYPAPVVSRVDRSFSDVHPYALGSANDVGDGNEFGGQALRSSSRAGVAFHQDA